MEQNFVCFQLKVALFLIPLEAVFHIIPGRLKAGEPLRFFNQEVDAVNFSRLWDPWAASIGKYTILLREGDDPFGILTDEISGVFDLSRSKLFDLPQETRSPCNSFIQGAVYLEPLDSWAFLVDPQKISALKMGGDQDSLHREELIERGGYGWKP